MIVQLAKIGSGIVLDWFQGKREKAKAKHETELKVIANTATWEQQAQKNAQSSWKDEYWTIILSLPFIGAFVPPLVPYIKEGFAVLNTMPEYYIASVLISIGASFGYRKLVDYKTKIK